MITLNLTNSRKCSGVAAPMVAARQPAAAAAIDSTDRCGTMLTPRDFV